MAFEFQYYTNEAETNQEIFTVVPAPTDVEYPEKRYYDKKTTDDGAVVIQRMSQDNRSRKWIWEGYRDTVPGYTALWNKIKSLEVKARLDSSLNPVIQVKDDITGVGGFDTFTDVKIVQADREVRKGGGTVTYDKTFIEFIVVDPTYTEF